MHEVEAVARAGLEEFAGAAAHRRRLVPPNVRHRAHFACLLRALARPRAKAVVLSTPQRAGSGLLPFVSLFPQKRRPAPSPESQLKRRTAPPSAARPAVSGNAGETTKTTTTTRGGSRTTLGTNDGASREILFLFKRETVTRPCVCALGLLARLEEELHAEADAEEGPRGVGHVGLERVVHAELANRRHCRAKVPDAREDQHLSLQDVRRGRHVDHLTPKTCKKWKRQNSQALAVEYSQRVRVPRMLSRAQYRDGCRVLARQRIAHRAHVAGACATRELVSRILSCSAALSMHFPPNTVARDGLCTRTPPCRHSQAKLLAWVPWQCFFFAKKLVAR